VPTYDPLELEFGDIFSAARAAHFETQYRLAKERTRALGGIPDVGVTDTSYVDVPGAVVAEMALHTTAQLHAMGLVSGGTGSLRLWDITSNAMVTGSEITFTATSPTLQKTGNLELVAGRSYKLQVKSSNAAQYAIVYGAQLVTQ
jgi:hypothetical protein